MTDKLLTSFLNSEELHGLKIVDRLAMLLWWHHHDSNEPVDFSLLCDESDQVYSRMDRTRERRKLAADDRVTVVGKSKKLKLKPHAIRAFDDMYSHLIIKKSPLSSGGTEGLDDFKGIHPQIKTKCTKLYASGNFVEAVEKSFKVVRDRLRALTGHERGSDAFGKGKLHIRGAAAPHVEEDFNSGAKYLTMAIDMFRNEKVHTSDAKITDPVRAQQYLMLSSLAMYLLDEAEVRP